MSNYNDDNMLWKVRKSERIFHSPWLTVNRDKVELPNGKTFDDFYVLHYPTWINVIAITEDGQFILERQYRHAISQVCTEICAGCAEEGEDPLTAAKRELLEETGCTCTEYTFLGEMLPTPAYNTEITYMYLARGLSYDKQSLDPDEFLDVEKMPLSDAVRLVMDGTIRDGKTQIILLKAAKMLGID